MAAIAGDRASLDAVWREHRRWIAAILLAHKPSWVDVDDLLQEVASSFVRKASEIREASAIRPWLRTVAINAAHAAARAGRARPFFVGSGASSLQDEIAGGASARGGAGEARTAPESLGDAQEGRRLMELAGQLADGYREPLLLKCVQGLSYREVGRILGLPETTVETRIARARKMLRALATGAEVAPERPEG